MITETEFYKALNVVNRYIKEQEEKFKEIKEKTINIQRTTIQEFIDKYNYEMSTRLRNVLIVSCKYYKYLGELLERYKYVRYNFYTIRNAGKLSFDQFNELIEKRKDEITL